MRSSPARPKVATVLTFRGEIDPVYSPVPCSVCKNPVRRYEGRYTDETRRKCIVYCYPKCKV